MARPTAATPEQIADEILQYLAGNSCPDIAEFTGRPVASIRYHIRKAGLMRNRVEATKAKLAQGKILKATPALAAEAHKLIAKGWTGSNICKRLNVSKCTLTKMRKMAPAPIPRPARTQADTRIPYEEFKRLRDQQQAQL